ncbi:MAG: hypothetical protein LKM39_12920 [Chiayiivirga sp.]|nr:hypothetical protein [Chiayiivirga sp.]
MSTFDRRLVRRDPARAGTRGGERRRLRREHQLVHRALRRAEAAVDREGAGDVGGVVAVFGTGIDQHQVAVGANARVLAR